MGYKNGKLHEHKGPSLKSQSSLEVFLGSFPVLGTLIPKSFPSPYEVLKGTQEYGPRLLQTTYSDPLLTHQCTSFSQEGSSQKVVVRDTSSLFRFVSLYANS